jgi:hypothetical protein
MDLRGKFPNLREHLYMLHGEAGGGINLRDPSFIKEGFADGLRLPLGDGVDQWCDGLRLRPLFHGVSKYVNR